MSLDPFKAKAHVLFPGISRGVNERRPRASDAAHAHPGQRLGPRVAQELVESVGMPRAGSAAIPFTQAQLDVVAEWFVRGLPELEDTLPQDPPPTTCDLAVSVEVDAHVAAMKTQGWRALNATSMMAMFGCGAATDPRLCLASVPFGTDQPYGAGWDLPGRGKLRVLADVTYRSSFWTRSSPDGRFIGHGVQNVAGSYILDLQRGALQIPVNASFDPNWFPDNSGFVFQGAPRNTCAQSVLTSNPTQVSMTEPGCTSLAIARYCVSGGKPGFSYDERWAVYHHYVTPTDADAVALGFTDAMDPGFAPYKMLGAANLHLLELATGAIVRITNMQPGQYALFPHFRSDGWIYAVIRHPAAGHEYMVASDAALIAEQ